MKTNNIAVIYARYSSAKQNDESIEQQVECCEEYAKQHGLKVVQVYADRATTGTTDKRESFQRMVRDSATRTFTTIIAYKSNRISRKMLQAMSYEEQFSRNGVRIVYAKEEYGDTVTGRYMLRSMMNLNQFYSENLAEDVKRGMNMGAKEGKAMSMPIFGYKIENGQFVIDSERADTVRRIYNMYAEGSSIAEITKSVSSVLRPNGKHLVEHSIRDMLNKPIYCGEYEWNGIKYENVPAIIDKDLYDRVQESRRKRTKHPQRHISEEPYVLSGAVRCALCNELFVGYSGKSHTGKKFKYYKCKNPACPRRYIRKDKLEQVVFDETKKFCLNGSMLKQAAKQTYQYMLKMSQSDEDIAELKQTISECDKKIANIVVAVESGIYSPEIGTRLTELRQAKEEAEQELKHRSTPFNLTEKDVEKYLTEYARHAYDSNEDHAQKVLTSFINRIEVYDEYMIIFFNIFQNESDKKTPLDLESNRVSLTSELVTHSGAYTNLINGMLALVVPFKSR